MGKNFVIEELNLEVKNTARMKFYQNEQNEP